MPFICLTTVKQVIVNNNVILLTIILEFLLKMSRHNSFSNTKMSDTVCVYQRANTASAAAQRNLHLNPNRLQLIIELPLASGNWSIPSKARSRASKNNSGGGC